MTETTHNSNQARKGRRLAALLGRLIVGGLFIYAAVSKIADPAKFTEEIRAYELAPLLVTNLIAIILPWIEILAGALLIVGLWRLEARWILLLMLVGFTIGKISVEARGMNINCGCWGSDWMENTFHGIRGILLNLALLGMLLLDFSGGRRSTSPPAAA
jgi:putative oxidoreductase